MRDRLRKERRAAGLCVLCGTPRVGKTYCATHREAAARYVLSRARARKAAGLCVRCDAPRVTANHCERHQALANAQSVAREARKRDAAGPQIRKPRVIARRHPEPPPVPGARWIPLNRGKFALVDEADFADVSRFTWWCSDNGYARRALRKDECGNSDLRISLHRHLMRPEDGLVVDHINSDGLDNRRSNLRVVTQRENVAASYRRGRRKQRSAGL